jgi:hypothetical protein
MSMVGIIKFKCTQCEGSDELYNRYGINWCPVCLSEYKKIKFKKSTEGHKYEYDPLGNTKQEEQRKIDQMNHYLTKKNNGCFIATATFDSYNAPEVIFFRNWRDNFLIKSLLGRLFIYIYYRVSPVFAKYIEKHIFLKSISKYLLTKLIKFID